MRCQFCVIRAVRRNLQFLPVWVSLLKKSIVQRDGQAQERAQAKLERNRRWFERKKSTFLVRAANAPVRAANAHYMESSILRLTRAVQTTSVASTPQNVSGLAVDQGNHARIFVDLRLCGDRSPCWVLTPSAPDATVLTPSKLCFWHALDGKTKEDKTFRQESWTVNCKLTTEKVCFFSREGGSSEIARYAAGRTDCEKIDRVHSTMYRPEVSKCHVPLKQRKALNFAVTPHAYPAIKASISARNAANLCSDLLD